MIPPKAVRKLGNQLAEACDVWPVLEWVQDLFHWRMTVSNDRVVMTMDYKVTPSSRWVWAGSTLSIDGVQQPLASGFEHFVRVWNNPEEIVNETPVPPPFSTSIQVVDLDQLPSEITETVNYAMMRPGLVVTAVGHAGEHFWAADFVAPRSVLRLHWTCAKKPAMTKHIYMIVDGEDQSDLAEGEMAKAFAIITQVPHLSAPDPASIDSPAAARRDRGVEVRSTHVIRT